MMAPVVAIDWRGRVEKGIEELQRLLMLGDGDKFNGYRTPEQKAEELMEIILRLSNIILLDGGRLPPRPGEEG